MRTSFHKRIIEEIKICKFGAICPLKSISHLDVIIIDVSIQQERKDIILESIKSSHKCFKTLEISNLKSLGPKVMKAIVNT